MTIASTRRHRSRCSNRAPSSPSDAMSQSACPNEKHDAEAVFRTHLPQGPLYPIGQGGVFALHGTGDIQHEHPVFPLRDRLQVVTGGDHFPEGKGMPDWFQEKVARMFSLVETGLEPLAGHHSQEEIAQAARALWGGVHGICILAITNKLRVTRVDSVQELIHSLMSNYLRGFMSS